MGAIYEAPPPGGGTIVSAVGTAAGTGAGGTGIELPAGVVLQEPDGGIGYYAANNFTKATAYPTSITYSVGDTVDYTTGSATGWDHPKFFPISIWLSSTDDNTDIERWLNLGINTMYGVQGIAGNLDRFLAYNFSLILQYVDGQSVIDSNRAPGAETVGVLAYDEPELFANYETAILPLTGQGAVTMQHCTFAGGGAVLTVAGPVTGGSILFAMQYPDSTARPDYSGGGLPAHCWQVRLSSAPPNLQGGPGDYVPNDVMKFSGVSFSDITITQAAVPKWDASIIGNRFFSCNFSGAIGLLFQSIASYPGGAKSFSELCSTTHVAGDGNTRKVEASGYDFYYHTIAFDNAPSIYNMYNRPGTDPGPAWGYVEASKGSRYGDGVSFLRNTLLPSKFPLVPALDNSNAKYEGPTPTAYDPQPVEMGWAAWSSVIHGARGLLWFNNTGPASPSGCMFHAGHDNTFCSFMQTAQSCTFAGTIDASTGELTVTTSPTSGRICRGMRAVSGVSGTCMIIQQLNNYKDGSGSGAFGPGYGVGTKFKIAGTAGNQSGTFTFKQSKIGMGLGAPTTITTSSTADAAMNDGLKFINDAVRTMAPVINSKFAVANAPGNGYVKFTTPGLRYCFPSNTGVKDTYPPQTAPYGAISGIDCCVHCYEGPTYTSKFGDVISPGFYIFATTSHQASDINIPCAFHLADTGVTSITVIGEGRSISMDSPTGFTDTFDYAWTVHIYRVNH